MSSHPDHEHYVVPWRKGHKTSIVELYKDSYEEVIEKLRYKGLSLKESEDCFQESFLIMLEKFRKKDFVLHRPAKGFLYGIYSIKIKEYFRSQKSAPVRFPENSDIPIETESEIEKEEEVVRQYKWNKLLDRTFNKLDKKCTDIFNLVKANTPTKEIAEDLDITIENLYVKRHRCRNKWNKLIEKDPEFKSCKPESW